MRQIRQVKRQLQITNYELRITNYEWRRQRLSVGIFVLLCINAVIAPAVYAASDGALERRYAYALGLLGLVTLGLVAYLFVVVFQPERF